MKLIVGLGNPGKKYESTWHNVGFLALDELAKDGFDNFKEEKKFKALVSSGMIGSEKVLLVKPQTFMNNSGESVQAIAHFYKVSPEDVIVVHDEFDIELGKIRISHDSSAAGHNGIKSIISHLGTQEFTRVRIGIKPTKPLSIPTDVFVLKKIGLGAKLSVRKIIKNKVVPAIIAITQEPLDKVKNQFN